MILNYYRDYEIHTVRLNSALLHGTLGQCGETFIEKRNIENVSEPDQNTTTREEAKMEVVSMSDQEEEGNSLNLNCFLWYKS